MAHLTQLIPLEELAPGAVTAIRNGVIDAILKIASAELALPQEKLVVRDIRPVDDLQMNSSSGTPATTNDWKFTTGTTIGWENMTEAVTMADQRWVAIYGVKDLRMSLARGGVTAPVGVGCHRYI